MGCCCSSYAQQDDQEQFEAPPLIELSEKQKGTNVKLLAPSTVAGFGSIFADSPVLQDKGYFEATLKTNGTFAMGVAIADAPLEEILDEKVNGVWTVTNNRPGLPPVAAGDVLGCAIDQADYPVQVYFYKGTQLIHQMSGVRGEVSPAFSVGDGASIEVNFGARPYVHIPPGFQGIIKSKSLL